MVAARKIRKLVGVDYDALTIYILSMARVAADFGGIAEKG